MNTELYHMTFHFVVKVTSVVLFSLSISSLFQNFKSVARFHLKDPRLTSNSFYYVTKNLTFVSGFGEGSSKSLDFSNDRNVFVIYGGSLGPHLNLC